MTEAQLSGAESDVDDASAPVSGNPINPYVTLTTLPSSAPRTAESPNPYVVTTTSVPRLFERAVEPSADIVHPDPDPDPDPEPITTSSEMLTIASEPVVEAAGTGTRPTVAEPRTPLPPAYLKESALPTRRSARSRVNHPTHPSGYVAVIVSLIAGTASLHEGPLLTVMVMSVVSILLALVAFGVRRGGLGAAAVALIISVAAICIALVKFSSPVSAPNPIPMFDSDDGAFHSPTLEAAPGSRANPHQVGEAIAVIGDSGTGWLVRVEAWNPDATAEIEAADERNRAPEGSRYIAVQAWYRYVTLRAAEGDVDVSAERFDPGADLSPRLALAGDAVVGEAVVYGMSDLVQNGGPIGFDEERMLTAVYLIPDEWTDGALLVIQDVHPVFVALDPTG